MPTTTQYSVYAQAALASYANNLIAGATNNAAQYKEPDVGMSNIQANTFDKSWSVLQQSTSTNGFSAVLLQHKDEAGNATGEKVLAIAGTGTTSAADWITNLVNIAQFGTVLGMPQYASLETFYGELVATGKLGAGETITVTGHSLGGFLAQAFTARHSSVVSAAYTYNAPGFGTLELLQGFLGIIDTGAASKITNVHATDGVSVTAGLGILLGTSQGVRIEEDTLNPLNNHSVVRLGDSLAVQGMLATLDPSAPASTTNLLVQAASHRHDDTLESLLDAVRRLVMGPSITITANHSQLVLADSLAVKVVLDRLDPTLDFACNQTMSRRAANSVAFASRGVA